MSIVWRLKEPVRVLAGALGYGVVDEA